MPPTLDTRVAVFACAVCLALSGCGANAPPIVKQAGAQDVAAPQPDLAVTASRGPAIELAEGPQVAVNVGADRRPVAADLGADLLYSRLTPALAPLPPVPFVAAAVPRPALRLDQAATASAPLGAIIARQEAYQFPRAEPGEFRLPMIDAPPLPTDADPVLPQAIRLPAAPRAYAPSGDPARALPMAIESRPPYERATAAADPAREAAVQLLLQLRSLVEAVPAPFAKLSVPDPFENLRAAGYTGNASEADPPTADVTRPPVPPLPEGAKN